MLAFFISLIVAGILTIFVPNLFWNIQWKDMIEIVQNKEESKQVANFVSDIAKQLGLSDTNLYDYTVNKIILTVVIGILIFLALFFMIKFCILKGRTKALKRK